MEPMPPPLPISIYRIRPDTARPHSLTSRRPLCWPVFLVRPWHSNPYLHPVAAYSRMSDVLRLMHSQGYITLAQQNQALSEAAQPGFLHHGIIYNNLAPHFVNYALNELATVLHVKVR